MARQDVVHLYGKFGGANLVKNTEGVIIQAIAFVDCVRGERYIADHTDKTERSDRIPIITKDAQIIAKIENIRENDIVFVKGTVSTQEGRKKITCPECKTEHTYSFLLVTVTPIDITIIKNIEEKTEAMEDLYNHREFSNELLAVGTLRADPTLYKTKSGAIISEYQMLIGRKFRIATDDPAKRHDSPCVKAYGDVALDNKLRLVQGSEVLIDGFIQSRKFKQTFKCKGCGAFIFDVRHTLEIVPYAVEYLTGYHTDADFAKAGIDVNIKKQEIYDNATDTEKK